MKNDDNQLRERVAQALGKRITIEGGGDYQFGIDVVEDWDGEDIFLQEVPLDWNTAGALLDQVDKTCSDIHNRIDMYAGGAGAAHVELTLDGAEEWTNKLCARNVILACLEVLEAAKE